MRDLIRNTKKKSIKEKKTTSRVVSDTEVLNAIAM